MTVASRSSIEGSKTVTSRLDPLILKGRQKMKDLRKYGNPPYRIALLHGGPGAAGEMAPVAKTLSDITGILEPLQTAQSVSGQVEELKDVLYAEGEVPLVVVGFSWGGWLGFILSAMYPGLVKKLVLISSGAFQAEYAAGLMETRLSRLSETERSETMQLIEKLEDPFSSDKDHLMLRMGSLISLADSFDPLPHEEIVECSFDIHQKVWEEAAQWRRSGRLLSLAGNIQCPVVAIHGDYDPTPPEGIMEPLSPILKDFSFILLENCGHYPWYERQARGKFYTLLRGILGEK